MGRCGCYDPIRAEESETTANVITKAFAKVIDLTLKDGIDALILDHKNWDLLKKWDPLLARIAELNICTQGDLTPLSAAHARFLHLESVLSISESLTLLEKKDLFASLKSRCQSIYSDAHALALHLDPAFILMRNRSRCSRLLEKNDMQACNLAVKSIIRNDEDTQQKASRQVGALMGGFAPLFTGESCKSSASSHHPGIWWRMRAASFDEDSDDLFKLARLAFSLAPASASSERSFKQRSRARNKARNRLALEKADMQCAIAFSKSQSKRRYDGEIMKERNKTMENIIARVEIDGLGEDNLIDDSGYEESILDNLAENNSDDDELIAFLSSRGIERRARSINQHKSA